ncbi:MAG: replication-associated recombination protein A [Ruminococcaceae bacterium]|nr:replication-associated recombination protein A [Oscillospiraceae bacterium]
MKPLADAVRPQTIDDVVGQSHIIGEDKFLTNIIKSGDIPNMVFFGPSGTGKTTVANICASVSNKKLYKLNATNASTKDIKDIASGLESLENVNGVLLYLDEIQNFNKKQQQSLLEYIENGSITLIASTTENPYFYVYNAILSRCTVVEFKPVEKDDIKTALERASKRAEEFYHGKSISFTDEALEHLSCASYGDVRKALTSMDMAIKSKLALLKDEILITQDDVLEVTQKSAFYHDKDSDNHYDTLSAFQKSIRGSDPDAAVHYLARLIEGGDLISICRRLLVISAEDIGLAYPTAITVTKACVDSAMQLGFPEARIPLAEAVIFLASLPKSNSAICAVDEALADIRNGNAGTIPAHLRDGHYGGAQKLGRAIGYKYPHSYPNSYVKQQYLPDNLVDKKYYNPGINATEDKFKAYLDMLKKK